MAGGEPLAGAQPRQGAKYTATIHAKQGDLGSVSLPHTPTNTTWRAGQLAEVSWTMRSNHGGGYSYRLCPRDEKLTEACFQRTSLHFVGVSSLRWDSASASARRMYFNATDVGGKYTFPRGSMWRKNPIPVLNEDDGPDGKVATTGLYLTFLGLH